MDNVKQNNNNYSREEASFKYFGDKWCRVVLASVWKTGVNRLTL